MHASEDYNGTTAPDSVTNIRELFEQQQVSLKNYFDQKLFVQFQSFEARISSALQNSVSSITNELQKLNTRTSRLEDCCQTAIREAQDAKQQIESLSERLISVSREIDDKIDRLEAFSRRDNLRFFNVPQAHEESYEECAKTALNIIKDAVPEIKWHQDDISRAHRIGKFSAGQTRPKTLIVKFSRWSDKMMVLNRGRERLRQVGMSVASDLTDRQRQTVEEHRRQGLRAYFRGNRLVVAGPLRGRSNYTRPIAADNYNSQHYADRHPHHTFREPSDSAHDRAQSTSQWYTEQDYHPWSSHHFPMLPRRDGQSSVDMTSLPNRVGHSEPSPSGQTLEFHTRSQTTATVLSDEGGDSGTTTVTPCEDSSSAAHDHPVRPQESDGSSYTQECQPSEDVTAEMLPLPTSPPEPRTSDSDIQVTSYDQSSTPTIIDTTVHSPSTCDSRADPDVESVTFKETDVQGHSVQCAKGKTSDKTSRRLRSTSVPSTCSKRQTTITETVSKPHGKSKAVDK